MNFYFFYNSLKREKIFEEVFDKYYTEGFFGNVDKSILKETKKHWFDNLWNLIYENRQDLLLEVLQNGDKFIRECFDELTSENLKNKPKKYLEKDILNYTMGGECDEFGKDF